MDIQKELSDDSISSNTTLLNELTEKLANMKEDLILYPILNGNAQKITNDWLKLHNL